ncbi:MAG: redox-regulated ATPase YchF [Anaerolineae bacterium]|nr:MAG: redox-regulated ATPase YchF [Anaerolineae bacterium]
MPLEIGIVGLPNVGKSTLFNALTRAGAAVASYPFTTIEPNIGVVPVEDRRLTDIAALIHPEKVVPTTVRFVDIAGLVKGAHRGEGLGNQFLGHIRNVDAMAMVVRCFEASDIPHVTPELDPISDVETVDMELILADLATVGRRIEKVKGRAKARPKEYADELAWLERLRTHLDSGVLARGLARTEQEEAWAKELFLLTAKPRLYVANVSEDDCPEGGALAQRVAAYAATEGAQAVAVCAQVEMDLLDWPPDEAASYLAELGLTESGLQRLVHAGYRLLDLITFFTTTGGRVVQAWTVQRGTRAPQAAGKVHTDMERGFIRAEVLAYDDLMAASSVVAAREKGLLRLEGKEYVVQDGDVIHFRFAL